LGLNLCLHTEELSHNALSYAVALTATLKQFGTALHRVATMSVKKFTVEQAMKAHRGSL
jgi:hypothetical protein